MDAIKFLKEFRRLCNSSVGCEGCALEKIKHQCFTAPMLSEEFVSIVENWSAEHPRKTRLQDFMEKHPNAPLNNDAPLSPPRFAGYCKAPSCIECELAITGTPACWDLPLEE